MTNTLQRLEQAAMSIIDEMESGFETGKAFAIEQAPEVCREILAWQFWSNGLCAVMFALIFVALACLFVFLVRKSIALKHQDPDGYAIGAVFSGVFALVTLLPVTLYTLECIKAEIAPRIVIIEKLAEAVR